MRFPERTRVSVLGSLDFPDRDSSRCGGCSRSGICVALPDRLLLEIIRNLRWCDEALARPTFESHLALLSLQCVFARLL